tara:strand:+ start:103 stop:402 length:300 start_codon:yes stop_codon:yes gene_type:complete
LGPGTAHIECIDENETNKIYELYDANNNGELDLKLSLEALFYLAEAHGMTINDAVYDYVNDLASQHKYFTTELDLSRHAFYRFSRDVMSHFGGCNIRPR